MNFDPQSVAAPAIVAIAAGYLARITWKKWLGKRKPGETAGCGSCGSCPSAASAGRSEPNVVQIGPTFTNK